jgi:hypothetical protein
MWTLTGLMFNYLLWSVIPPLRRIQKELPPRSQFLPLTFTNCKRNFLSNHILWPHSGYDEVLHLAYIMSNLSICFRRYHYVHLRSWFRQTNHMYCKAWEERKHKKAYKGFDLSVPHSFLTGALCEEVRCIAKVGDGYRAIAGAHRYVAVSASRSTSLFPMWWWSFCFSVLEKSCILHTAIAFAALIMKTFLRKHFGNCFRSSQSSTQDEHP